MAINASQLQSYLNRLALGDETPFQFGPYNDMKASKAIVGRALWAHRNIMLLYAREVNKQCHINVAMLQDALSELVKAGAFHKFDAKRSLWEGANPHDAVRLKFWCVRNANRFVTMTHHWRRFVRDDHRRTQAMRLLDMSERKDLMMVAT